MLSYQHGYHAGCFADVVKHFVLSRILDYLVRKEKPVFYLETHAGRGLYDLTHKQAVKTKEFEQGIKILWPHINDIPALFAPFSKVLTVLNPDGSLRYYPGSPLLAIKLLRNIDRLSCFELHSTEYSFLKQLQTDEKRVHFAADNGLLHLNSDLPPKERRGLVFLDPAYELKNEYKEVPRAIKQAYSRFSNGVYCLWYPIIDNALHQQLLRELNGIKAANNLCIEFMLDDYTAGMKGCGLWIINPPYCLKDEMKEGLSYLSTLLNPGVSNYQVETILN